MTVIASAYENPIRPGTVVWADANGTTVLTHSFSAGVNMNRADPTRYMIALVKVVNGALTPGTLIDSASLGGVGMSIVGTFTNGGAGITALAATIPTGTSGTLTLGHSAGTGAFMGFSLWSAYNLPTSSVVSSAGGLSSTGGNVSVPFRGVGVALGSGGSMTGNFSQDFTGAPGGFSLSAASLTKQLQAGTRAGVYSCSCSVTGNTMVLGLG